MARELIDIIKDFRDIIKPINCKWLIQQNYEGKGLLDAAEFDKEFDQILDAAEQSCWIPVKLEELTDNEKQELAERHNVEIEDLYDYRFACPLPDDGEEVLICTKWGICITEFSSFDGEYFSFEDYNPEDVLAWMQLPAPYKGDL